MTQPPEIAGPPADADLSKRNLDCQFALEPAFLDLVNRAHWAGWGWIEIVIALTDLADSYMLRQAENVRTAEVIRRALDRRKD